MDILKNEELYSKRIIVGADDPKDENSVGWRSTSYDSRVGKIFTQEGEVKSGYYKLPPRGIVWLISRETYKLPSDVTGITTQRTTWTRQGVLTLTSGIVDPGYEGPISTAVINFSKTDFPIHVNDEFFRTVFFKHSPRESVENKVSRENYEKNMAQDQTKFSETFLTIEDLSKRLVQDIFKIPKWGVVIGMVALGISLLGLTLPPMWKIGGEIAKKNSEIIVAQERLARLEDSNYRLQMKAQIENEEIAKLKVEVDSLKQVINRENLEIVRDRKEN